MYWKEKQKAFNFSATASIHVVACLAIQWSSA